MKLLFDQNISYRIIRELDLHFEGSVQVRQIGLENCTDTEIWTYARDHDYSIVTFDSDFADIATVYGHPPKIIWLRTGNTATVAIAFIMNKKAEMIKDFITKVDLEAVACLTID